jgi:hypothetical protein
MTPNLLFRRESDARSGCGTGFPHVFEANCPGHGLHRASLGSTGTVRMNCRHGLKTHNLRLPSSGRSGTGFTSIPRRSRRSGCHSASQYRLFISDCLAHLLLPLPRSQILSHDSKIRCSAGKATQERLRNPVPLHPEGELPASAMAPSLAPGSQARRRRDSWEHA